MNMNGKIIVDYIVLNVLNLNGFNRLHRTKCKKCYLE